MIRIRLVPIRNRAHADNRIDPTGNFSLSSVTDIFSTFFSPIGNAFQQTFHSTVSFVQSYVVAPLQTAWSSVKHFAGLAQTLVTSAFRRSSPPSQNATNAAQVAGGPPQSGIDSAPATQDAGGGNWLRRAGSYIKGMFVDEFLGIAGGPLNGNIGGFLKALYGIGKGVLTWDGPLIKASALNLFGASVMLRSGSTNGLAHPGGLMRTADPGSKNHNAGFNHDGRMERGAWLSSDAHFQYIRDAWGGPGREMGPWGQAYRLYATVGLGLAGSALWAAGQ